MGVPLAVALALFLLPAPGHPGVRLLDWEVAADLPWDVLLLFGGVAVGVGVDPLLLVVPVALAATCAARTIRWTARAARLLLPLPGRPGPGGWARPVARAGPTGVVSSGRLSVHGDVA